MRRAGAPGSHHEEPDLAEARDARGHGLAARDGADAGGGAGEDHVARHHFEIAREIGNSARPPTRSSPSDRRSGAPCHRPQGRSRPCPDGPPARRDAAAPSGPPLSAPLASSHGRRICLASSWRSRRVMSDADRIARRRSRAPSRRECRVRRISAPPPSRSRNGNSSVIGG